MSRHQAHPVVTLALISEGMQGHTRSRGRTCVGRRCAGRVGADDGWYVSCWSLDLIDRGPLLAESSRPPSEPTCQSCLSIRLLVSRGTGRHVALL
ncbi:hypothetical protein Micbo1qcDRAFT_29327 [Microdochium bolleyi]|uniref:Uncharacterized protein n=1 Tax=Microdochium bolleyi TaxID=196109 RepID=A0A136JFD5_9PEZI|nr:hypothetical protein Micbo1qcDRAFT_29327 [Microdochium bolleyi]